MKRILELSLGFTDARELFCGPEDLVVAAMQFGAGILRAGHRFASATRIP